jgi:hypothetical protein
MYQKPGVEVTQVQRSATPILTTPSLEAVVIGLGYKWVEPDVTNEAAVSATAYNNLSTVVSLTPILGSGTLVSGSLVVDLKENTSGRLVHVPPASLTVSGSNVTIAANLTDGPAQVIIGGLTAVPSGLWNKVREVASSDELRTMIGAPVSWNPLAFGASVLMQNSASAVNVVPIGVDNSDTHTAVAGELETKDIYAIAPLTGLHGSNYIQHVNTMSLPANKKERLLFISPTRSWSSGTKTSQAQAIAEANAILSNKRVFSIHPDVLYVRETRHVATLRNSFIQAVFGAGFTYRPMYAGNVTIASGSYKAGDLLEESHVAELISAGRASLDVFAPVPGYYATAAVAGQVISKSPAQPLTNVALSGFARTLYSQDYFTEAQLNVMGGGGTYILTQNVASAPLYSRHQVSTDNTSVAKRELSITTSVDYVAKFMRNSLQPYIGRFVISDNFINLIFTVLSGISLFVKRNGIMRDVKIVKVEQDAINPDTINIEVELLPLYPANYIKITLVI